MKAEHRHELKTNELAEWIANFPHWAMENLKTIIYVTIVIVVAAGLGFLKWYYKDAESARKQLEFTSLMGQMWHGKPQILQARSKGLDLAYALLTTAGSLETAAQTEENNPMAALAFIKQAEALRAELHYRATTADEKDVKTQIDKAIAAYNKAIEKSGSSPTLTAMARVGLGLCEENLGNIDKARQIYREIAENPSFNATTAAEQAKHRLIILAGYQPKIVFAQPKMPTAAEVKLPEPQPQTPESNGPVK